MDYRLDDIDKRILFRLARDARNTSAREIAEEVNVSPGTIRNRIDRLENLGIIQGYHAHIDYEKAEGLLINLFMAKSPVEIREAVAKKALQVPGIVNIREVLTGKTNLQIKAVGQNSTDLTQIARALSELGIEIEEEYLVHREYHHPYHPYGAEQRKAPLPLTDLFTISQDSEIMELMVTEDSEIEGKTLKRANEEGLIKHESLVISIEREDEFITPKGDTRLFPGDLVTILARAQEVNTLIQAFR